MRIFRHGIAMSALAGLLLCGPALAQAPREIADHVAAQFAAGNLHGAILVADGKGILLQQAGGVANLEGRVANAPDTRFRIGSITKQFTAMLVLQEASRGGLSLDDTVIKHLPWYRRDTGARITIRQLLNHVSGLPDLPPDFAQHERQPYARQAFIERFCSGDLRFPPGERFGYSNAGYYILGAVLEAATGQSYGALLEARIFKPAGMSDTFYSEDAAVIPRAATGYARNKERPEAPTAAAFIDPGIPFAMGGIRSTVGDLYKWDRALYGELLLPGEMKKQLYTPPPGQTYANGWINYSIDGAEGRKIALTMHQGSINGFSGVIFRDLQRRTLVVILNNLSSNGSEWRIGETLMRMLAARPY